MGAVAKRRRLGLLAAAEPNRFRFFGLEFDRLEWGPFVGIVAKGLFVAQAATAPKISFPFLDLEFKRLFSRDMRFIHRGSPIEKLNQNPVFLN